MPDDQVEWTQYYGWDRAPAYEGPIMTVIVDDVEKDIYHIDELKELLREVGQ